MKLIDRSLFAAFLKAYLLCLVSLLSLYVVIDLFTKLDDFAEAEQVKGLLPLVRHIATYYGYQVIHIFDQLCEPIVLLAAMFTVAWVQKNNELLPLLSAGVPTRRMLLPVLAGSALTIGAGIANQELVIPRVADSLLAERSDQGNKIVGVQGMFEPNLVHIDGDRAFRPTMEVTPFYVTLPEQMTGELVHLSAKRAYYLPERRAWLLEETTPPTMEKCPPILEQTDPGRYYLKVQEVDFEVLTRNKNWYMFTATGKLRSLLYRADGRRQPAIAVLFHQRLMRPVLGVLLVLMGLSLILRDPNRNVFVGAGLCLIMCALFFAAQFICRQLGEQEWIAPAVAAWMPVLLFAPFGFALFDAIHT
jgi:lipopolysaccharide export system permease protein